MANDDNLSYKYFASIIHKLFKRSKNQKLQATPVRLDKLNEIDIELDWIQGAKENVEFLNANLKHYNILFRVQKRAGIC